jgi:uncharacterized protein
MIDKEKMVEATRQFVINALEKAEAGHDWWHVLRVYNTSIKLAKKMKADETVVALASLLHDVGDSKFHDGDETVGPKMIREFLISQPIEKNVFDEVMVIIENMSFKRSFDFKGEKSIAFQIVQDADRLDAIGAIGIARAFSFGGFKGRPFYDPAIPPQHHNDGKSYKASQTPTINHFYEKLLLLKDQMNTRQGRMMAEERHAFMLVFLERFYGEWDGKC